MGSVKFSEKIIIQCTPEFAFDYTQDYKKRLNWDTFLKSAELINGALKAEVGAKSYCVSKNGLGMETVYLTFNRPGTTAIQMTKGPFLFKSFLGTWTFKTIDRNSTEVVFLYSFRLRFPFNLAKSLITKNLQMNVKARLIGLKKTIENQK